MFKPRVLLVGGSDRWRTFTRRLLVAAGYDVIAVPQGTTPGSLDLEMAELILVNTSWEEARGIVPPDQQGKAVLCVPAPFSPETRQAALRDFLEIAEEPDDVDSLKSLVDQVLFDLYPEWYAGS